MAKYPQYHDDEALEARVDAELSRMEAEAGCELPDFPNSAAATDKDRARRLLACDDPPRGADELFLRAMLGEIE